MDAADLRSIMARELRAFRRELEAYPDEASIWRIVPGTPNTGGTLALHVAGNLRHFLGSILGKDGYVRDRNAEFARRDVSQAELIAGIDSAIESVERTLATLSDAALRQPYPEPIAARRVETRVFLLHLASHLAYHLGQIDYHRRTASGDPKGVDAVSVRELPEL
jgi:uncharacterized damage-inducible protein DinB